MTLAEVADEADPEVTLEVDPEGTEALDLPI